MPVLAPAVPAIGAAASAASSAAPAIGAAASLAGTGVGVAAQLRQSHATAAKFARDAEQARLEAEFQERQIRRQHRFTLSEAVAQSAGTGVEMTHGTPLLLEVDRVKQAELDALFARHQGAVQAAELGYGARLARRQPVPILLGGGLKAASILTDFIGAQVGPPTTVGRRE